MRNAILLAILTLSLAAPAQANHGSYATYEGGCFRFSGAHFTLDLLAQQWTFSLSDLCTGRAVRNCTAFGSIEGGFVGACGATDVFSTCGTGHWHFHGSGDDAHGDVCMTWNGEVVPFGRMRSTD